MCVELTIYRVQWLNYTPKALERWLLVYCPRRQQSRLHHGRHRSSNEQRDDVTLEIRDKPWAIVIQTFCRRGIMSRTVISLATTNPTAADKRLSGPRSSLVAATAAVATTGEHGTSPPSPSPPLFFRPQQTQAVIAQNPVAGV